MTKLNILISCEYSGTCRDAFIKAGHNAISCDFLPTDVEGPHYQGDVKDFINSQEWDLMLGFPSCTYLCSSGMHWTTRGFRDKQLTEDALDFVRFLMDAPIKHIAIENPVGCISSRIRKPDQIIQPYFFGEDASKQTCLWLKNLPKLVPTQMVEPKIYTNKHGKQVKRWANQCVNYGQEKSGPSADHWKIRSKTYGGIAQAIADQWSLYICEPEEYIKKYGIDKK